MRPETHDAQTRRGTISSEVFLRSINPCYDAEAPERIAHYHPTAKSIAYLRALVGLDRERAFFIVAPYGSGKSITATYLLHLTENRREAAGTLAEVAMRLARVSPELGAFVRQRRRQERRFGLVLALHGYARSLPQTLKAAAIAAMTRVKLGRQARSLQQMPCDEIEQAIAFLHELQNKVRAAGGDRLLILWDEFGRHLESLLAEGRPSALLDIQLLAEFVSRADDLPMTLSLLLHQDLLRYASHVPQSVRAEWTKIEGRFRTIQYIDDSKELYRLIAAVVSSRTTAPCPSTATMTAAIAMGCGSFATTQS
jgi:hypothetical protein